jgi:hypothetical protein
MSKPKSLDRAATRVGGLVIFGVAVVLIALGFWAVSYVVFAGYGVALEGTFSLAERTHIPFLVLLPGIPLTIATICLGPIRVSEWLDERRKRQATGDSGSPSASTPDRSA